jgi:hypothetical protein
MGSLPMAPTCWTMSRGCAGRFWWCPVPVSVRESRRDRILFLRRIISSRRHSSGRRNPFVS